MATVNPTLAHRGSDTVVTSWSLTSTNRDGAPVEQSGYSDRVLQVNGTWGGATVIVQGSNDGSNWFTLNDIFGAATGLTADGMVAVAEAPLFIRPYLSVAGSGATLTATLVARKLVA